MTLRASGLAFPRSTPYYLPRTQPLTANTDEVRRAAAITVADRSTDPDDCAQLLEALGLLPYP